MAKTPSEVYRGNPPTDDYQPDKNDIIDLLDQIREEAAAAAEGVTVKATWAELSAIDGSRDGQPGRVIGPDAGTHTDPVVGGTVANVGEYAWDTTDEGWQRVSNLLVAVASVTLIEWAEAEAYEVTSTGTIDAAGIVETATVKWPDASAGTYTVTTKNAVGWGVDAYEITHAASSLKVVQAAVTRNDLGMVTVKPALTVV